MKPRGLAPRSSIIGAMARESAGQAPRLHAGYRTSGGGADRRRWATAALDWARSITHVHGMVQVTTNYILPALREDQKRKVVEELLEVVEKIPDDQSQTKAVCSIFLSDYLTEQHWLARARADARPF